MQARWQNARLIHLPVHASWLNQIELYFPILQRKAFTANDLATLDALTERLLGFRQIARPFEWTSTRQDLDALLVPMNEGRVSSPLPGRCQIPDARIGSRRVNAGRVKRLSKSTTSEQLG
jgi:hypothetical protein